MKVIILLGPPGCGKGTQAEKLERQLGYKKLSTGDMLRNIVKQDSPLSIKIQEVMDAGDLIDDELIIKVIEKSFLESDCQQGVILDGFPRTLIQAKHLEKMLLKNSKLQNAKLDVISIKVNDISLIKRITGRFFCSKCLSGYHDEYKPTIKDGICDQCGSKSFSRRNDDNEETVKRRLENYYNDSVPIIEYYKEQKIFNQIDGEQTMEKVYTELTSYL